MPDDKNTAPEAFWESREELGDYLWARCTNCGFIVESQKAVTTGCSSNDYTGVKYHYCPICGKRMGFRGINQKNET